MTDPERDEEFEAFLKRRSVLPNAVSVHDKLEPPGALDDIVLKKAREAIKAHQQPQRVRAPRWAVPLGLAATILLCLSVAMNVSLNVNRPTANFQRMAPESTASAPRLQSAAPIVEPATGANEPSAGAAPAALARANTATRPTTRANAAAPEAARQLAAPRPRAALRADEVSADAAAQSEVSVSANRAAGASGGLAAPAPAAALAAAPASAPAPARDSGESEVRKSESASGGSASGEVTLEEARVAQSQASTAVRPRVATEVGPVPPASPPAEVQGVVELKARAAKAAPHPQDPDVWLRQIDALRAQGKTAQADAEMRRFRAAFPAYPAKPPADPTKPAPVPSAAPSAAADSAPASSEQPK